MSRPEPAFGVILPAAGIARRFGSNKLTRNLQGRSVLARSLDLFVTRADVGPIVIAADLEDAATLGELRQAIGEMDRSRVKWCQGGACRAASVLAGVRTLLALEGPPTFVAIHDAARPAASQGLIDRVFAAAIAHGAAVPATGVVDTLKQVTADGFVAGTPPREELVAAQTPQAMRLDWLAEGFERCPVPLEAVTDDVSLLELAGRRVKVVAGEAGNLKLTHPVDLGRLSAVLGGTADA